MRQNSNYYPPGGHDWVATDEIRRSAMHNDALLGEKYAHDVRRFRQRFYGKLATHGALDQGFGWAIFDDTNGDSSISTAGGREVLLVSHVRPSAQTIQGYVLPLIRIITNEMIINGNNRSLLTEEATINERGGAQYLMDAVEVAQRDDEQSRTSLNSALKESTSPLFLVAEDGVLAVSNNAVGITPAFTVTDPGGTGPNVTPFGWPDNPEDRLYALSKAEEILSSVIDNDPMHYHQRPF